MINEQPYIKDYLGKHCRVGDLVCYPDVSSLGLSVGLVERVGADYVVVEVNRQLSQRQFIKVRT